MCSIVTVIDIVATVAVYIFIGVARAIPEIEKNYSSIENTRKFKKISKNPRKFKNSEHFFRAFGKFKIF